MIGNMHPRSTELLNYFEEQRRGFAAAFLAVPASLRAQAPAPDRWSPAAIVEHVSIAEFRIVAALTKLLEQARADGLGSETSTDPFLPSFDASRTLDRSRKLLSSSMGPSGLDADAAWEAVERSGNAVRAFIRAADGLAIGKLSMPHPFFGPMSGYEWLSFIAAHEARHAEQIRETAEALAPSSSPGA